MGSLLLPTPVLRPALAADAAAVARVKRAAAGKAYGGLASEAEVQAWLARRATPAFVADRIAAASRGEGLFLLAELSGQVVGSGLIRPEAGGAYLADLYCDPPQAGVGTALLTALLAHSRAQGWGRVRCFVLGGNPAAERFFTRAGFVLTGRQPNQELTGDLLELVLA